MFQNWIRRAYQALDNTLVSARTERLLRQVVPAGSEGAIDGRRLVQLRDVGQREVLTAVRLLQAYAANCKRISARRHRLFKMMSWRQQKLCTDVGYLDKLDAMDRHINDNQKVLSAVAKNAIDHYGIQYRDFDTLRDHDEAKNSSSNYRVIEALSHFLRDWDASATEIEPLLTYIKKHLALFIPASEQPHTCIIVPGSGLGRIAHEIAASAPYAAVHAVEFSGLMHVCNQFIYSQPEPFIIYPYVHNCSNFTSMGNQFRSAAISTFSQPKNLHLHQDDFLYFKPDSCKNVVVVTAFFMDTAENLVDYMDRIGELTLAKNGSKGFWINAGPLKYGTAARVELNAEEFSHLRKKMGWKDVDNRTSLDDGLLVGYTTDKESLWQGYYGMAMWASKRCT